MARLPEFPSFIHDQHQNRRVVVLFNTRSRPCHVIAALKVSQFSNQVSPVALSQCGIQRCIREGSEHVDQPHESIRRESDRAARLDYCLESQFASRPRSFRLNDPVATNSVELSPVFQNLEPRWFREAAWLLCSVECCQGAILERFRPLVGPSHYARPRGDEGHHVSEKCSPEDGALRIVDQRNDSKAGGGTKISGWRGGFRLRRKCLGDSLLERGQDKTDGALCGSQLLEMPVDCSGQPFGIAAAGVYLSADDASCAVDDPRKPASHAAQILVDRRSAVRLPIDRPKTPMSVKFAHA